MAIFRRELKFNLYSLWTAILVVFSCLLTLSGGIEYAAREGLAPTAMAQEWAHRTTFAAVGLPVLALTVAVWFHASRDRRYGSASLIFVRPVSTRRLVAARLAALSAGVLLPHLAGVFAGVLLVGLLKGLWPDGGLLLQSTVLNLVPGLTALVVLAYAVTCVLPDLRVWVFPVAVLWLLLVNVPATSLFWFYRTIDKPLFPLGDTKVWLRIAYAAVVAAAACLVLFWTAERQRTGCALSVFRSTRVKEFRVLGNPLAGRFRYALKTTLGSRLPVALLGVTGLAVVMTSPFGILRSQPDYVREYFSLAFSELLFPLIGLLVTYGFAADRYGMSEIIYQKPRGEGKALEQKLFGLGTYLLATCLVYSLWLHLFQPSVPFVQALLVLFPSMLLFCGLSILVGAFCCSTLGAYAVSLAYWGAAYYLQDKFPWFLSPLYHLAEYSFKLQQDLLWQNKTILLVLGTAAAAVGLWKTMTRPVTPNE